VYCVTQMDVYPVMQQSVLQLPCHEPGFVSHRMVRNSLFFFLILRSDGKQESDTAYQR
jgi:hypothetical protein